MAKVGRRRVRFFFVIFFKVLIVCFLMFLIFGHDEKFFSNDISLLAVSENSDGDVLDGSVVGLSLEIRKGSGRVYVDLGTLEDVDTQISILNSQGIACDLFELDCEDYDFFYRFNGSALVLKGPSASSAIAVLVAKSLRGEKIGDDVVITGSLNSGGLIGSVGGVDEKIEVAKRNGFRKVLVPVFSNYSFDDSVDDGFEVVEVFDVVDAYNNFDVERYELEQEELDREDYVLLMSGLADRLCQRSSEIRSRINFSELDVNGSVYGYVERGDSGFNSSVSAMEAGNFYSRGSFCYNAAINYRIVYEILRNLSLDGRETALTDLRDRIVSKSDEVGSERYRGDIFTINDFYVYLVLRDRLSEAMEFVDDGLENIGDGKIEDAALSYSYALERFNTVWLWEEFLVHEGRDIFFDGDDVESACFRINREIVMKNELLRRYGFDFFVGDISKQSRLASLDDFYLCVYRGLQLEGKIDTVLGSFGIGKSDEENFIRRVFNFTRSRISVGVNGDFPLIPYIYYEYAGDLIEEGSLDSALLYLNYALSYGDLNLYFGEKEEPGADFGGFDSFFDRLLGNWVFFLAILVFLGFWR